MWPDFEINVHGLWMCVLMCSLRPLGPMWGSFDCVCILRETENNQTTTTRTSITHTLQILYPALMGQISKPKCMFYGRVCCRGLSGPWVPWGVPSIVRFSLEKRAAGRGLRIRMYQLHHGLKTLKTH